ncbi:MAG: dephospho-CoA kinase [Rhodoferax sp.]|nr:dephospho-CoA kinase [Rhodoferax sp.]
MVDATHIGLTGGVGSGKSTVAALWVEMGATLIDADALARSATTAQGAAIPAIVQAFGAEVLTIEGALDRDKMRTLAFSDPDARSLLESIVHPWVGKLITQAANDAKTQGANCLLFDIPLLVASAHWRTQLWRVCVVDCLPSTQIARVVQRNGLDPADVQRIIDAQTSRTERLKAADAVIFNDGIDKTELALRVREIATQFGL